MVIALVFFLITVVDVAIVGTTAFLSNVHESMTKVEISEIFGTSDGSVPAYEVFPIVLPNTRRRRGADDKLSFNVRINGTEINLNFKRSHGYLATRYTPVWLAIADRNAHENIRYVPLPTAMKDIGEFKMYQDVDNEAAIVRYTNPRQDDSIEGIVGSNYVIKSLPQQLSERILKVSGNHRRFEDTPTMLKRSIELKADEVNGYFVVFEALPSSKDAERSAPADLVYNHGEKGHPFRNSTFVSSERNRTIPEAVYPEILIVLDHNAIRRRTITQALRFTLAFWNAVDMVYSLLDETKVRLNIAGIIISADDTATPYITNDTSRKVLGGSKYIVDEMSMYFYKEAVRFPSENYDMIIAMTTMDLCFDEIHRCLIIGGVAYPYVAYSLGPEEKMYKRFRSTALVSYDRMFGGVDTAVHESAHLLGVDHDEGKDFTADCNYTEGFVMAAHGRYAHQSFKWSPCSKLLFSIYFSSSESEHLRNKPIWAKGVNDTVMPGTWLTLDGQCENLGFNAVCKIPRLPLCVFAGCKYEGSNECFVYKLTPLPGSKCDANKYCDDRFRCASELTQVQVG